MSMGEINSIEASTETLQEALQHPVFYHRFHEFSAAEHNQENLLLWKAIEDFHSAGWGEGSEEEGRWRGDEKRVAEQIVSSYIRSGAPFEVNMEEVCGIR